jgi:hypothetical protein
VSIGPQPELELERFAKTLARALVIELAIATPIKPAEIEDALGACRRCGSELRAHERPERICDACLRAHQTRPRAA